MNLLCPDEGLIIEIGDVETGEESYATLREETWDIVHVVPSEAGGDIRLNMRSLFTLSFMKPPAGLTLTRAQAEEWPAQSWEVVAHLTSDETRRLSLTKFLTDAARNHGVDLDTP